MSGKEGNLADSRAKIAQITLVAFVATLVMFTASAVSSGRDIRDRGLALVMDQTVSVTTRKKFAAPENCTHLVPNKQCKSGNLSPIENKYHIEHNIGTGATAKAFILRDQQTDLTYVGLFPRCEFHPKAVVRSAATIKYAQLSLGAPSIMQMKDVACFDGHAVPVFSRCPGRALRRLHRDPVHKCLSLTSRDRKIILMEAFKAVKYMMEGPETAFWHADMHAGNFFYDNVTESLCLIDLGNAQQIPWWVRNFKGGAKTKQLIEKFQYARTITRGGGAPEPPKFHKDDIVGLGRLLGFLLNVTLPGMGTGGSAAQFGFEACLRLAGSRQFRQYVDEYDLPLPSAYLKKQKIDLDSIPKDGVPIESLRNECNADILDESSYELLKGLLQFSYTKRWQFFKEAFTHPFFSEIL